MFFQGQGNLAGVEERPTEKAIYYKVRILDDEGKVFETNCTKELYETAKALPRFSRIMVNVEVVQGKYNFTNLLAIKEGKQQTLNV